MAIDQDPQTLGQWFLMVLGLGGGAAKFVTHENRIKRLESDRKDDVKKIDQSATDIAEMKGTLDSTASMVKSIHDHIMGRSR